MATKTKDAPKTREYKGMHVWSEEELESLLKAVEDGAAAGKSKSAVFREVAEQMGLTVEKVSGRFYLYANQKGRKDLVQPSRPAKKSSGAKKPAARRARRKAAAPKAKASAKAVTAPEAAPAPQNGNGDPMAALQAFIGDLQSQLRAAQTEAAQATARAEAAEKKLERIGSIL